ncbi:MAG: glycosyltransferase [Planctomycetota bacterium]
MKPVLIVTSAYAPLAVGGAYRVIKLVKHLPTFGWKPLVLRVHRNLTGTNDPTLADDIPPEAVVRVVKDYGLRWLTSAAAKLTGYPILRSNAGIFYAAKLIAKRLIAQYDAQAIFLSAPPDRLPALGLTIAEETGLPLITDFRDPPWQINSAWKPTDRERRYYDTLAPQVYSRSSYIIANTDPVRDQMISTLGLPAEKVVVVPNGFDEEDYKDAPPGPPADRKGMEFFHPGWVRSGPEMPAFLDGVKRFLAAEPDARQSVRFVFTGKRSSEWRSAVHDAGLSDIIELLGHIPHRQSVHRMCAADVNLIVFPPFTSSTRVPQKTYEYLRAGRPVLALIDEGPARNLLAANDASRVCHPHDSAAIASHLADFYRRRQIPTRLPDDISRFSRVTIAKSIADLLTQATGGKPETTE